MLKIWPFIAFFSLTAVALVLDKLFPVRWRIPAALSIAAIGLADQRAAAVHLNAVHKDIAVEYGSLKNLVRGASSRATCTGRGLRLFRGPTASAAETSGSTTRSDRR
jgi:hypothetical protein